LTPLHRSRNFAKNRRSRACRAAASGAGRRGCFSQTVCRAWPPTTTREAPARWIRATSP
jgi:hypothetical protein